MTAARLDASAKPPAPAARRRGLRLPGSRLGMLWLGALLIVGALLAFQFGRQVYANWEIGQRAADIEAQIARVEAENAALQAQLDYLNSDAYVSAEARRLSNVGAPGERVLIIPDGAEAPLPESLDPAQAAPAPLLRQWFDLFFGAGPDAGS
ncbi:MAG: septum formation initiator family protein [Chloroflexi bacterium]|nr:septum formation initiator family protein [Chloroflexota bacterium]